MKYGIIGHRSWIAQALIHYLTTKVTASEVSIILKSELDHDPDLSEYDAVFLFAGRARPREQERMAELLLVSKLPSLTKPPKKMVYVSSLAVERESTPYTKTKMACESIVLSQPWGYVLRPPVVFGPGQDPNVNMLIPCIARAVAGIERLVLEEPFLPFHMMHVGDVCHGAWLLGSGGSQGRVLRLLSAPEDDPIWTPIEVVKVAAPGLRLYVPGGWSLPPRHPKYRESKLNEDRVIWTVSPLQIMDTVESLVRDIAAKEK